MKKVKYSRLLSLMLLLAIGFTVKAFAAEPSIANQISVLSYDDEKDYLGEIIAAVNDGSEYAMEIAAIYEQQRNLKIVSEGLDVKTTDFFSGGAGRAEVLASIERYLNPAPYVLSDAERGLLWRAVMAESGGECFEGQMMVAQCILDGALRNSFDVSTTIRKYQIVTSNRTVTESVKEAVRLVFDEGQRVTESKADLWYAPSLCVSTWHESQNYVTTIGVHRFFWMNSSLA